MSGTTRLVKYDDLDLSVIADPNSHASRHAYGGEDVIDSEALKFSQLDKSFGAEVSQTVSAGGTYTIPKGIYLVSLAANTRVEYTPDGGTTWRTLYSAGTGGLVISDGSSVRLYNSGTGDETSYLLPVE